MVDIAKFYEGTTLGMAGDSLLVGCNVPPAQPQAARRALLCVRETLAHVAPPRVRGRRNHGVDVGMGAGMSRGSANFGNVGAPSHMACTLSGDAVNVAARLIQPARGGEILLSAEMALYQPQRMRELQVQEMPPLSLQGKDAPVAYFWLAGDGQGAALRATPCAARHGGARAES